MHYPVKKKKELKKPAYGLKDKLTKHSSAMATAFFK